MPLPALFVVTAIGLVLAMEGGFLLGGWRRKHSVLEKDAPVGAVVAATLGLVGFVLAMTFSFATSRFEGRQEALLGEINAIGTSYLRADLLPEPQREQSKHTLREYLDIRVNAVESRSIEEGIDHSEKLHTKLWSTLLSLSPSDRNSISVSLYIESLNQVIDLHEQRVMAGVRLRIPAIVWSTLLLISILGMGELGYQTALTGSTRTPVSLGLVIAFALLLHLIADLDRPLEGKLKTSHIAMRELRHKLQLR
jgi:hypothetical protein